jgi:predicted metalloenzyme YecM
MSSMIDTHTHVLLQFPFFGYPFNIVYPSTTETRAVSLVKSTFNNVESVSTSDVTSTSAVELEQRASNPTIAINSNENESAMSPTSNQSVCPIWSSALNGNSNGSNSNKAGAVLIPSYK